MNLVFTDIDDLWGLENYITNSSVLIGILNFYVTDLTIHEFGSQDIYFATYSLSAFITVQVFNSADMNSVRNIHKIYSHCCSMGDASALFCSKKIKGTLITNQLAMAKIAKAEGIPVKTVEWVKEENNQLINKINMKSEPKLKKH